MTGHRVVLAELSLASESRFPETETISGRDSVRLEGYTAASPSIWR
jgi:hypothetical protein